MCGIIGGLTKHEIAPVLLEGLTRLEYRGYDSAGIATVSNGRLVRRRAVGKLVNLSDLLVYEPASGMAGIGHTRWATHGEPSVINAHPHKSDRVAVVHNGIIENFRELRMELSKAGYVHESQTDTEIIVLLLQQALDLGSGPVEAARATLKRLAGTFALCFLFDGEDDLLICARKGSPLAIGHGVGEMFVGSDAIALAPMTDRVTYLEDGDWAVITRKGATIFDRNDFHAIRTETHIQIDTARVDKMGHKHFMAKEIAEQPAVITDSLNRYITETGELCLPEALDFSAVDRVVLVACGTASFACHVAKYWFEQFAGLPAEIDIASEFRYRDPVLSPASMAVFVSQSGETADTLAALRYAKDRVAKVVSVVNVPTSSIAREADLSIPIHAGVEIGVASTKAFTCQLVALALMALKAGLDRKRLSQTDVMKHLRALSCLPGLMTQALQLSHRVESIVEDLAEAQTILFLGRGLMAPLALEGALKLKEISYIHAEGYASGELKHGPIALIDRHVPVIVLAPYDNLFDKTVSNMQEVMARGGKVLLISDITGVREAGDGCWKTLVLPNVAPQFSPILYSVAVQLLAYHTALAKGTDVDQPRNLAKSVTVE